jgi:hypothetical protein
MLRNQKFLGPVKAQIGKLLTRLLKDNVYIINHASRASNEYVIKTVCSSDIGLVDSSVPIGGDHTAFRRDEPDQPLASVPPTDHIFGHQSLGSLHPDRYVI